MAKKTNKLGTKAEVKQAIKAASSGGINKTELQQIGKQTGATAQQLVQQMDIINRNVKQAGGEPSIALNSGAANMLVKQAEKQPQSGYDAYRSALTGQSAYGTGNIGKTIQSMIGTPGMFGDAATPGTGMMIGGTMIRPGGRVAVRPMGAAPAVGDTTAATTAAGGTTAAADATAATGDAFDFQSMLDALTAMQQPAFDMSGLEDMFQTQFDQLSSQFDQMNPLRLAQLGRAYGSDAIRARQNIRKTRQDYRRGIPALALGQALGNMAIGGGLTI